MGNRALAAPFLLAESRLRRFQRKLKGGGFVGRRAKSVVFAR
jgi:hypothetical protein